MYAGIVAKNGSKRCALTTADIDDGLCCRKLVTRDDRGVLQFLLHRHETIENRAQFRILSEVIEQRALVD